MKLTHFLNYDIKLTFKALMRVEAQLDGKKISDVLSAIENDVTIDTVLLFLTEAVKNEVPSMTRDVLVDQIEAADMGFIQVKEAFMQLIFNSFATDDDQAKK